VPGNNNNYKWRKEIVRQARSRKHYQGGSLTQTTNENPGQTAGRMWVPGKWRKVWYKRRGLYTAVHMTLQLCTISYDEKEGGTISHLWWLGSIPDEVIGFFSWPNPSSSIMTQGSTPLTEMSTRNLPGGKMRLARKADNLTAICETTV
jgi:hypothetical protein